MGEGFSIEYIASLSRLALGADELESLKKDMEGIIGLMDTIKEYRAEGVEAADHISGMVNVLRGDEPAVPSGIEAILSQAPSAEENCFSFPKIVE